MRTETSCGSSSEGAGGDSGAQGEAFVGGGESEEQLGAGVVQRREAGLVDEVVAQQGPLGPVAYYGEVGATVTVGAEGSVPVGGAGIEGAQAQVLGVKHEPGTGGESGKTTFYYKGTRELAGQLQVLGQGPDGALKGEVVVALTMQDGEPVSAKIEAAGKVRAGFFAQGEMDVPLGGKLPKAGSAALGVDSGNFVQGKVALEMDLTNQANLDALADVTQSVGMPLLADHGTPGYQDPAEAVSGLRDRFTDGGPVEGATLTGQVFEGSESKFEVGFFAGELLTFGAGGHLATSSTEATDAFYYAPGTGFVQWQGCDSK